MVNKQRQKAQIIKSDRTGIVPLMYIGIVMLYGLITFAFYDYVHLRLFTVLLCAGATLTLIVNFMVRNRSGDGVGADNTGVSPLLILLTAFTLLIFCSMFYAYSPTHAFSETQRYLSAFAVFIMLDTLIRNKKSNIKKILFAFLILFAINTFLSIETASSRILLHAVIDVLNQQNENYASIYGYWNGQRMMTLLNANVTAPLNLIGILICHYFNKTCTKIRQKRLIFGIAVLLGMGFILCVSIGSILFGGITIIFSILICGKGARLKALLYYAIIFFMALCFSIAAYAGMGHAAPLGLLAPSAAILCFLSGYHTQKHTEKLEEMITTKTSADKKTQFVIFTAFIAALVIIVIVMWLFAPEFIISRFKAIFTNGHAASRVLYWQAAWDIFQQNPAAGFGAGAFETKFMQVQNVYDQSKYVHNHYLQTLVETGILGLLLYGATIIYAIRLLIKRYRADNENKSLVTMILSAFVMISGHTAIDFDMSFEWFAVTFWMFLAVVSATMDTRINLAMFPKTLGKGVMFLLPVCMLLLCIGNGIAESGMKEIGQTKEISAAGLTQQVEKSAAIDPLHSENYKADYLQILTGNELPPDYATRADQYARALDKFSGRSIRISEILVRYYISGGDYHKALSYTEKIPRSRVCDGKSYDVALELCEAIYENGDPAQQEAASKTIRNIAGFLKEVEKTAKKPIVISEKSEATISLLASN